MIYSCLHTHTELCDGSGTVEDYCNAAFEKGLVSIGFSAHAPLAKKINMPSDWHLADENVESYCALVRAEKEKWSGKLAVYLGLEVDYIKNYVSPADSDFQKLGLDFIIASVHILLPDHSPVNWAEKIVGGKKLIGVDGSEDELRILIKYGWNGDGFALAESYWEAVIEMCGQGKFDILGHCDLIKKYNGGNKFFSTKDSRYIQYVKKLASLLADLNIVVELNTGGLNRGKINECYPSLDILKIFRKKNIPVTINADAHIPAHLNGHYETARTVLLEAGYTDTMLFKGRENGEPLWEKTPL
ncbi:MAG: histidinol-phosphatase [Spirochaetaceae bacterium]|jgi:histidinol-phosphatase (PHP family)|nr:histidinol-phosphatase [Spirochaetaceae bacterium]